MSNAKAMHFMGVVAEVIIIIRVFEMEYYFDFVFYYKFLSQSSFKHSFIIWRCQLFPGLFCTAHCSIQIFSEKNVSQTGTM